MNVSHSIWCPLYWSKISVNAERIILFAYYPFRAQTENEKWRKLKYVLTPWNSTAICWKTESSKELIFSKSKVHGIHRESIVNLWKATEQNEPYLFRTRCAAMNDVECRRVPWNEFLHSLLSREWIANRPFILHVGCKSDGNLRKF